MRHTTFTAALAAAMVLCLLFTSVPAAAAEDWKQLDDMPFQTYVFSTAYLPDGKVFFNGGQKEGANGISDETWIYDTHSDTWGSKASSPLALVGASAVYMPDGCVYVFLGKDPNGMWDHGALKYDVAGDSWTELPYIADMGFYREIAAIDDFRILIAGGLVSHPLLPTDACQVYDTRYNLFLPAEDLPYPIGMGSMVRSGGSLYYIGGYDTQNMERSFNVLRYDLMTGHWEMYGQMSEPIAGGEGVVAVDGLVHIYGCVFKSDRCSYALDLRDCSILPSPAVPMKSVNGGIAATDDGRIIAFGGENDGVFSQAVHSLTLYNKEAWLGSDTSGPGTSVRVYADFRSVSFENQGMTATAYLVKGGVTYGSCQLSAVGNGTASGLLEVPEDLGPREYQVLIADVDTGVGIPGIIEFDALELTVTDAPTPTDRIGELEDQLDDLKENLDGKMDAWVGYVLLGAIILVLLLIVINIISKKNE